MNRIYSPTVAPSFSAAAHGFTKIAQTVDPDYYASTLSYNSEIDAVFPPYTARIIKPTLSLLSGALTHSFWRIAGENCISHFEAHSQRITTIKQTRLKAKSDCSNGNNNKLDVGGALFPSNNKMKWCWLQICILRISRYFRKCNFALLLKFSYLRCMQLLLLLLLLQFLLLLPRLLGDSSAQCFVYTTNCHCYMPWRIGKHTLIHI